MMTWPVSPEGWCAHYKKLDTDYGTDARSPLHHDNRCTKCKDESTSGIPDTTPEEATTMFETTYGLDANQTTHEAHRPCPYHTEVEKQAWCQGYDSAFNDKEAGRTEPNDQKTNPYTSGDTSTAWTQGYLDQSYHPVPFNPTDLFAGVEGDIEPYVRNGGINCVMYHTKNPQSGILESYLMWAWQQGSSYPEQRPAWCDNRWEDRSVQIDTYQARSMVIRGIHSDVIAYGGIELPCPPYEYEYSEGGMQISAGKFKKWGSKDDWSTVLEEMQEKFDEMPEGIDVDDKYITIDVTVKANLSITYPVTSLVENENGIFVGSQDELESDAEESISNMDEYDLRDYVDMNDLQYADPEIDEWSAADIGYDLS